MTTLLLQTPPARLDPFFVSGAPGLDADSAEGRQVREAAQEARRIWRENLEARFRELAEQWRRETGMYSAISRKVQYPAYRSVIALGEKALPLILRELSERPAHWFSALKAIANESPLPADEATTPKRARAAWLKWGQERGLIE